MTTTSSPVTRPSVMRRAVIRLTEGQHAWGGIDVNPGGRGGWSRTRLTVYRPGTNAAERRRLTAARSWPVLGAALSILVLVALDPLPQAASFAGAVLFYALGFVVAARVTRRLRPGVRQLLVSVVVVGGGATCYGDARLLHAVAGGFRELDALAAAGVVTPVEYEAAWATFYARLPEQGRGSCRGGVRAG